MKIENRLKKLVNEQETIIKEANEIKKSALFYLALQFIHLIETELGELHRAERLNNLLIVCYKENRNIIHKIYTVLDHKGCLEVTWLINPTEEDKVYMSNNWEFVCNENPDMVKHFILKTTEL